MDKSPPTSSNINNIVSAAMSTAEVAINPGSPKPSTAQQLKNESVSHSPRPSLSLNQSRGSLMKMVSTESMDISDHQVATHVLRRQISQESDAASSPRSTEANQVAVAGTSQQPEQRKYNREEETPQEKSAALIATGIKPDTKEPHILVTPPSFAPPVNGDGRMPMLIYSNERGEPMMGSIPMNLRLTKSYKGDSKMEKPNDDTTYPITCGHIGSDLIWKKFICPGINAKCVKRGDDLYTPKEFVNLAGKSTLKDWKRAIRIDGVMLRRMIENGELNYYDHENNCSNQCRSNKNASFDNPGEKSFDETRDQGREHSMDHVRAHSEELNYPTLHNKRHPLYKSLDSSHGNQTGSIERSSSEDSGHAASPHLEGVIMREVPATIDKVQDLYQFWNGITRLGLFDDIARDAMTQIKNIHTKTKLSGHISLEDAVVMTNLVNSLEMFPSIHYKMSQHKHSVEKQAEDTNHNIQELENRLAEEKRIEQDLKRKRRDAESVISLTPSEKRQKRNITRLVKQNAVTENRVPSLTGTSSSNVAQRVTESVIFNTATAAGARLQQRELWPQIQAASSQMARMTVNGANMSAIPQMFFTNHPNMHTPTDNFPSPALHSAYLASQQQLAAAASQREATQSPKK